MRLPVSLAVLLVVAARIAHPPADAPVPVVHSPAVALVQGVIAKAEAAAGRGAR